MARVPASMPYTLPETSYVNAVWLPAKKAVNAPENPVLRKLSRPIKNDPEPTMAVPIMTTCLSTKNVNTIPTMTQAMMKMVLPVPLEIKPDFAHERTKMAK